MGKRTIYEYAIISYVPNLIRYEKINIGALLLNKNQQIVTYSLIPSWSKGKGIITKQNEKDLFKETLSYLNFLFKGLYNNQSNINVFHNSPIVDGLPKNVRISSLTQGASANIDLVFNSIIDTYVGNEYFKTQSKSESIAKLKVNNFFVQNNFVNNKIVRGPKIKPSNSTIYRYEVDYAFLDSSNLSLINTMPSNSETLQNWYEKMSLFSNRFAKDGKLIILHDQKELAEEKINIITDLKQHDDRVITFNTDNKEFSRFKDYSKEIIGSSNKEEVLQAIEKYNKTA
ncbi:MAG TPA: DUF3037 domain-containing protein [Candidatus Ligilactobacillus excrementavium]|nr:DUF3037 domain-containing protein [Candidatus Ligilactobacillus excrementavium]